MFSRKIVLKMIIHLLLHLLSYIQIQAETEKIPYSKDVLHEIYPDYGKKWMFFPDGNGIPTVMVLDIGDEVEQRMFADQNLRTVDPYFQIDYLLYTKDNTNSSYELQFNNTKRLKSSTFDPKKPTKFVVHGWRSSGSSDTCQSIKNEILKYEDVNVVIVNWADIADNIIYPIPMLRTRDVGGHFGEMIDFLIDQGARPDQMHIIGHSLGAHISGIAAQSVTKGRIRRVTGLDPALPGFEFMADLATRLDESDADFVDVIHTCAGVLGFFNQLGHLDVYPNGGTPSQPGCGGYPEFIEACSHGRSWQFFAETISPNTQFKAIKCLSWHDFKGGKCNENKQIIFGYRADEQERGTYYTVSNEESPFAEDEVGILQFTSNH